LPALLPSLWPPVGRTFAFVPPTPVIWVLIVAIFLLSALLLEILTRTRALTHRLWSLSAP